MRITAVRVPLCCGRLDRSKQQRAEPGGRVLSSIGMKYTTLVLTQVRCGVGADADATVISPFLGLRENASIMVASKLIH
jgi:hypothetical protein